MVNECFELHARVKLLTAQENVIIFKNQRPLAGQMGRRSLCHLLRSNTQLPLDPCQLLVGLGSNLATLRHALIIGLQGQDIRLWSLLPVVHMLEARFLFRQHLDDVFPDAEGKMKALHTCF